MKIYKVVLLLALLLSACQAYRPSEDETCGTYQGIMPAASGPGIDTTVILKPDYTYSENMVYIDEPRGNFTETGTYESKDKIITLTDEDGDKDYYRAEKGQIRFLDRHKKVITGSLADYYILKKTEDCRY